TPRETEVLEQLARGRDLSFMETKFMLSRNTIKMHVKHLYTKLDVHSKQEVIDLVEAARKAAGA
ncbi:MAG: LuxR C-terminal-related transcriptional regulator, partial [Raoultibacter sp.]